MPPSSSIREAGIILHPKSSFPFGNNESSHRVDAGVCFDRAGVIGFELYGETDRADTSGETEGRRTLDIGAWSNTQPFQNLTVEARAGPMDEFTSDHFSG